MLNFKQASIFLMVIIMVQSWLHASDLESIVNKELCIFSALNPQIKDYKDLRDAYTCSLEFMNEHSVYVCACNKKYILTEQESHNRVNFATYLMNWLNTHNIENNHKQFYEYIADYKIDTFGLNHTAVTDADADLPIRQTAFLPVIIKMSTEIPVYNLIKILTSHGANLDKPIYGWENLLKFVQTGNNKKLQELVINQTQQAEQQENPSQQIQSTPKITQLKVDLKNDDWSWKNKF